MQILRLLAARRFRRRRRAVSTITATATAPVTPRGGCYWYGEEEDEGPFFDLDLSCCSAPASAAASQAAESGSESEDTSSSTHATGNATRGNDLDFAISLQRSRRSESPSYEEHLFFRPAAPAAPPTVPPPLMFCASEPSDAASRARRSSSASRRWAGGRLQLRTLSFGSAKAAAFYGGGGRASFSRSTSSARSARLFAEYGSPDNQDLHDEARAARLPSGDVFRRYLSKISSRLRRVAAAPPAAEFRLRKSRSASFAAQASSSVAAAGQSPPARQDDSLAEKQDGIASAIAHCKESLHRASVSELDTSLLRSRSDPGP
ncbi:unnamed protein product [Urochloa humidicola]